MNEFNGEVEVTEFKNVDFKELAYTMWITENYPTKESARRMCAEATIEMLLVFDELKRVRGLASVEEPWDLPPTRTPHWWCVTPEGTIIDPTAHQYPTKILSYEEADESKGPPTGKCPNCGGLCYTQEYLCSDKCSQEYMTYLNSNTD
jgi:hypothetical protein